MGVQLRLFTVLIVGLLLCHCCSAQNPFLSGAIGSATGRSINSGAVVQTNFEQNEKNREKPAFSTTAFAFNNQNTFTTTQTNFETTKPNFETTKSIPFIIPSYASGILEKLPTVPSPKLTTPTDLLQPPVGNGPAVTQPSGRDAFRGIPTTTLNSFDADTTTLSPVTQQRFGSFPITPRSNFNTQTQDTTTNQPKPSLFTQKATIPQAPISFGTKVTTPVQTTTTFTNNFEKVTTTAPAFGFGFGANLRDDILGNQSPGYAVKADGSIDSQALPPQFRHQFTTTQFTRAIPSSTLKLFEAPTTNPTVSTVSTTKASTNFTHNPWLQQLTPLAQTVQIPKQKQKPFAPSVTNPFLSRTTQVPTTNNFQFDTTTQPIFQKAIGSGVRDRIPITTTAAPKLDARGQFTNSPKSTQFNTYQPTNKPQFNTFQPTTPGTFQSTPKPTQFNTFQPTNKPQFNTFQPTSGPKSTQFNAFKPTNKPQFNTFQPFGLKSTQFNTFPPSTTTTTTTTIRPVTTSFNNFAQKSPSPVTQSTTFNGFNTNKIGVTQSTQQSNSNRLPNTPSGLVIKVPEIDVLPPFGDGESTKIPDAFQTTKNTASSTENSLTTLPPTKTAAPTTTRPPIRVTTFPPTFPPTTNAFVITRQNQPSTVVNKPNQDLLPPVETATSSVTVHKSPAISLPSNDLLPPVTAVNDAKPSTADVPTKESKPSDFLPQLDLNPFTAPIFGSRNSITASTSPSNIAPITTTTSRPVNIAQPTLADSPFDYNKPAKEFVFQANVGQGGGGGSQQQRPQQQQQPSHSQSNTKYTGGFGGPPGVLTPYDNQRK